MYSRASSAAVSEHSFAFADDSPIRVDSPIPRLPKVVAFLEPNDENAATRTPAARRSEAVAPCGSSAQPTSILKTPARSATTASTTSQAPSFKVTNTATNGVTAAVKPVAAFNIAKAAAVPTTPTASRCRSAKSEEPGSVTPFVKAYKAHLEAAKAAAAALLLPEPALNPTSGVARKSAAATAKSEAPAAPPSPSHPASKALGTARAINAETPAVWKQLPTTRTAHDGRSTIDLEAEVQMQLDFAAPAATTTSHKGSTKGKNIARAKASPKKPVAAAKPGAKKPTASTRRAKRRSPSPTSDESDDSEEVVEVTSDDSEGDNDGRRHKSKSHHRRDGGGVQAPPKKAHQAESMMDRVKRHTKDKAIPAHLLDDVDDDAGDATPVVASSKPSSKPHRRLTAEAGPELDELLLGVTRQPAQQASPTKSGRGKSRGSSIGPTIVRLSKQHSDQSSPYSELSSPEEVFNAPSDSDESSPLGRYRGGRRHPSSAAASKAKPSAVTNSRSSKSAAVTAVVAKTQGAKSSGATGTVGKKLTKAQIAAQEQQEAMRRAAQVAIAEEAKRQAQAKKNKNSTTAAAVPTAAVARQQQQQRNQSVTFADPSPPQRKRGAPAQQRQPQPQPQPARGKQRQTKATVVAAAPSFDQFLDYDPVEDPEVVNDSDDDGQGYDYAGADDHYAAAGTAVNLNARYDAFMGGSLARQTNFRPNHAAVGVSQPLASSIAYGGPRGGRGVTASLPLADVPMSWGNATAAHGGANNKAPSMAYGGNVAAAPSAPAASREVSMRSAPSVQGNAMALFFQKAFPTAAVVQPNLHAFRGRGGGRQMPQGKGKRMVM